MKNKIIYAVLALVAIAAIIIIAIMGLNVSTKYTKNKQLQINIGKQFENEDIKQIAKEVFENEEVIVQKVELYGEIVSITVKEVTDEQLEQLNTKLNEKYGLNNEKADEAITVYDIPNLKVSDIIKPYILPIGISLAIIIIYAGIRYRRLKTIEVLGKIFGFNILAQVLYFSIIAIARIEFNSVILPSAIALYTMISILVFSNLESKNGELIESDNKK